MTRPTNESWEEWNRTCLARELAALRETLAAFLTRDGAEFSPAPLAGAASPDDETPALGPDSALDRLCVIFQLSSFERKILLLCAGAELDSRFGDLFSRAAGDRRPPLPTFSLALGAFADAHLSALLPRRPLRRWRLIEPLAGDVLTTSPLRIDEAILHYLTGLSAQDEWLSGLVKPVQPTARLTAAEQAAAGRLVKAWSDDALNGGDSGGLGTLIQLSGGEAASRRAIAAEACARMGLSLHMLPAEAVPRAGGDLDLFVRMWEREAALRPSGLLLEFDDQAARDASGDFAIKQIAGGVSSPLVVSSYDRVLAVERRSLLLEVPRASASEQMETWRQSLGPAAASLNGGIERLAAQFDLSARAIRAAAAQALVETEPAAIAARAGADEGRTLAAALWDACRAQSRPRLEGLAQRIEPIAGWDDLVLPDRENRLLSQIALQVRHRATVYRTWGFAAKSSRGLGISALFAGPSGTGKTMAGEALANELRLDLYRIDLSQVISKYIGETEKNLRRVFDAADESAAILLFDEADALFGKRSEVKDSHDRYANIEVSYLLQRMEAYRGLAILTTNRREALDTAFLRRIRFVVEFPFPGVAERAQIWRRVIPSQTPTENLRFDQLARLSAAGGNIRNIALGAAFLAADAGEPVRMTHLLAAARWEFAKIERPLSESETAGWV